MSNFFEREIVNEYTKLVQLSKSPIRNMFKIQASKRRIQAINEGTRDILNTTVTQAAAIRSPVVDKNNYKSYESQLDGIYKMYDGRADYGGEVLRGLIDSRVSLIGGEGLSFTAENKKTKDWIEQFFVDNKLYGSGLLRLIKLGELEGKVLNDLVVIEDKIRVIPYSYYKDHYSFTFRKDLEDVDFIESVTFKAKEKDGSDKILKENRFVFIRLGGSEYNFKDATTKVMTVLTDCENFSRAKYDLRRNGFLFGRYTPIFKTQNSIEAKAIKNDIASKNWSIGTGYAGDADFNLVGPENSNANAVIAADMLASLKCIAMTTGIPIHWLAYPELMSNRATAENLLEVVNAGTIQERLLWEEAFESIIEKARIIAVDKLGADNSIMGDFEVKLSFASLATLKQIIEVWLPLLGEDLISRFNIQNRLPGVDPAKENRLIKKEKEERAKNSPFSKDNKMFSDSLNDKNEDGEETAEEGKENVKDIA